ncbi:YbjN domain-containing protein [Tuwongella immobilis]|uniref:YbjN domain-containing protein n=1 Tax=Tuwongella immobilis TaxID=692036 RepID=A0A6C2YH90_9BACT|nr:YbjN domain-containing protein [Tuwongella immobilis]VIP00629.1 Putative uncharacterized protein OS=Anaerolinea thermophila (strain DSM 14523 / JCM 11388 / NBRC 100420 / UNI-1) GN=ANT_27220 PE=4 SV=1: YbjN [Tuwongella immobilis]VTR96676.1 Putative uncharacterized protein OS=Anaerolinea thermophila (strain DSM 14523 / JCM 11388 / NBRC 100420 / UNI-1) GN=ANT_27220 PE=4 SV=1: YbjN [Tuwongella immobilis]
MGKIFANLIDFMESEEWRYEILEGENTLRFHVKVKSGRLTCYAEAFEEQCWVLIHSYLPVNASEERRSRVMEFITRANWGMRIGNFELDLSDGEIRYKTSIDVEGGNLVNKMIDNLLQANLSTMDRYYNGLMECIYSDKSPESIIRAIEGTNSANRPRSDGAKTEDDDDDDSDELFSDSGDMPFLERELDTDDDDEDDDEDDSEAGESGRERS